MPRKIQRKRQRLNKPTIDKPSAKVTSNDDNPPVQLSSENIKVDSRRSKRVRKKTEIFQIKTIKTIRSSANSKTKGKILADSSDYIGDYERLLHIFPEEIWINILDNCSQSSDLENVSNASLYFRDLLLPKRTNFLFPHVWKILGNKYHENFIKRKGRDESFNPNQNRVRVNCNRLNIFRQYSILKLRLVCKDWNKSVEDFYQHHPSHFDTEEQSKCIISRTTKWPDLSRWSIGKFLSHFHNTHGGINGFVNDENGRNPFLSRKVFLSIHYEDWKENPAQWQLISTFLTCYGHYIWYLDLEIGYISLPGKACMSLLQYLFPYISNLKGLRVESACSLFERPLSQKTLKAFSFPKLERLEFLSLRRMPPCAQDMLERSNSHVTKLEFQKYNNYFMGTFHEFSCPHPKLKALAVTVETREDLKRLEKLSMKWNLTELSLVFHDKMDDIPWADVFALIETKWGRTLTALNLKLPIARTTVYQMKIMENCSSFRLRLPRLKSLSVVLTEFCSLDFILPLKKTLEELNVHIRFRYRFSEVAREIEKQQQIQFLGYTSRPLESNISEIEDIP